ncbi:MAG: hypothetical protein EOP83_33530 [Verrucomicrobiaceae bacterium]|nr:MAG: hypothetical protein EOP83_33530 [Verrucomicrobiaceae bacterium]
MAQWVRASTLGRPLLALVEDRCPNRVSIRAAIDVSRNRAGIIDNHLRDAIAWCQTNIGDSMLNYTTPHPQMRMYVHPAKEKINLDGTWAYGVKAFAVFYFANPTDATAFKLVWA